jgi:hypothetical protein
MEDCFFQKFLLGVLVFTMFSSVVNADTSSNAQEQAKTVMGNVYDSYVKILPYAYSKNSLC